MTKLSDTALTLDFLKSELHYNPDTGLFTRLVSRQGKGAGRGSIAGFTCSTLGYVYIKVGGRRYPAHRLAWFYTHGEWPDLIDHLNTVRTDNRLANLRTITKALNAHNHRRAHSTSSTGLLGASPMGNKFKAQIQCAGKVKHLGMFDTAIEAHEAYIAAKRKLHEGNTL